MIITGVVIVIILTGFLYHYHNNNEKENCCNCHYYDNNSPWVCACSSPVCVEQPYTRGWLTMMEGGWMWPGWAEDNISSSPTGTGFSLLGRNHIHVHSLGKCPHHCIFMHLRFSGKTEVQIPLKWLLFLVRRVPVLADIHGVCARTHFSLTVLSLPVKGISCDTTVALFCPFRKPVRHCPRWGGPFVLLVSRCFHAESQYLQNAPHHIKSMNSRITDLFHVHTPEQSSSIQPNLPSACLSTVENLQLPLELCHLSNSFLFSLHLSPFHIKSMISKATKAPHARCGRLRYDTLIKALNMEGLVSSHLVLWFLKPALRAGIFSPKRIFCMLSNAGCDDHVTRMSFLYL